MARVRQTCLALLAAAIAAVFLSTFGAPGTAGATTASRQQHAFDPGAGEISRAGLTARLLRVQNAERHRHGLRRLRASRDLTRAARRHARDMVRRHYFGHVSRAGRNVVDRVASTGYAHGRRFTVQENLFWWSRKRSAAAVLAAWLGSPVHRANVLGGAWRQFGVAAVRRSPYGRGGVTVVGVYGSRRG